MGKGDVFNMVLLDYRFWYICDRAPGTFNTVDLQLLWIWFSLPATVPLYLSVIIL